MDEASRSKASSPQRSATSPPFLAPGARVDRYELVVLVREDDGGSVWLASEKTPTGSARLVALRIAAPSLAGDERFRELLRQEVKLASGVAHPNVAQVLELGTDSAGVGPTVFVASEWVEGETLADLRTAARAKQLRIPPAIVLRILADACSGLHAAHLLRDRNGGLLNVVHGDVSPASIVIATTGSARVIDLGFMKARARYAGGANLGWSTAGRAPGQRVDRHSDVWGVGATLAQALADAAQGAPASERGGAGVASLVSDLAVRARSIDPVERFATAAEMQGAIEAAMMTLGLATSHATVAAFAKEHVGGRTLARAETVRAWRAQSPVVLSIPTPAVDSVPATVQSLRPDDARLSANTPPAGISSSISRPLVLGPPPRIPSIEPHRGRAALFVAGFAVAVLGFGASAYLALRPRHRVAPAPPSVTLPAAAATPPASRCPAGTIELASGADHAPFCLDAAPVTTEAYKACSDAGDCKRAATENRWPGITAKDEATYDLLCHERDPRAHAKEPMNCVDRDMAAVYCAAHGGRLPTEAEAALASSAAADARPGAFSEWSLRPHEPKTTRSYAIGFRCARSL